MAKTQDGYMFTILLGERAHLIEFPSLLLPPGTTAGSIVNISVTQNHAEEKRRDNEFWALQNEILDAFGRESPEPPKLQLRNVTQTSVTLEWPPLKLATAKLRSLDIYRNGQRLAAIPSPLQNTSSKLSGLDINTEYSFQLILRTTAGTFPSNLIRVRTHTMTDTSGISVCFGNVQDLVLLENAKMALREMNAKWSDKIQIDTTHFVCTTPAATPSGAEASGSISSAPGVEYQRALQLSIPVVQPQWILACHAEKKMVPIAGYYLGVNPGTPMHSAPFTRPQSMSQVSLPHSPTRPTPGSPAQKAANRASMPAPARSSSQQSIPTESQVRAGSATFEPTPEEQGEGEEGDIGDSAQRKEEGRTSKSAKRRTRNGTMDKAFKFPPEPEPGHAEPAASPIPESPSPPRVESQPAPSQQAEEPAHVIAPSSVEVPPPPPVEKERAPAAHDEGEEDVGETEEISLN
ncbi:hypothetical protein GLOTRDRAFT_102972 [Gloeophyllum trabeum ATCC 11539]|uniref:Uncharacterized protein n=1 Tax=Gloeophyllum trabeum (strain ATCC 11539 / FP-39264 / Madison 617) TaxID=670483 RepID=S7QI10_GLOTA|nr:uncharacterized protein GLOTRDRAFT_102972 [Gloeophyllum trabeum ATCC 11539]EPQ58837.1 hypothetical protein GLOTRDRAFT_102972 [Gloeophyllum trabeum ATCC 11539]